MPATFNEQLRRYASLAVHKGAGLQPGQRLLVRAPVECAPLARLVVEEAWQAGAALVDLLYSDDAVSLSRFLHARPGSFEEISTWEADALNKAGERADAVLAIIGSDPDLLKDQDPQLVADLQKKQMQYRQPFMKKVTTKAINWSIVAAPVPAWATKIYPDLDAASATGQLWQAIFSVCRLDRDDPLAAWEEHVAELATRREYMNAKNYAALHLRGEGTDLRVGLADGHLWQGGRSRTDSGLDFIANLPTEEIFSLPHRDHVDGTVRSTKPLSWAGSLIDDFELRFEAGRVVEMKAAEGEEVLRRLIDTDAGASCLGEIALVPHSSPISQSGLLFYNTLFDENASSHLALGKGYRACITDGATLSDEDYESRGGNESLVHVDFMVGSGAMDVDGITAEGETEAVMQGGEWAFTTAGAKA